MSNYKPGCIHRESQPVITIPDSFCFNQKYLSRQNQNQSFHNSEIYTHIHIQKSIIFGLFYNLT